MRSCAHWLVPGLMALPNERRDSWTSGIFNAGD
jgi:hypothetical protein